ncbi:FAD-dependent oxidoreductase [Mycobacterium sp. PS03-16]|uniref:FAD-dependent oxidoreductase n=1 Tax=Mycobacterium sp. PS03-16 TaxID=2559611 RepID=UPI001ADD994E|nr:FAD-dependent oxidoreductase [Mycobacterium sp. PS03-16]
MPAVVEQTGCIVAGGGPAGIMLGLLLARAGVAVTVLEKHADFLRDFRGDTVHASTLRMLDELGLGDAFGRVPHRVIESINATVQDTPVSVDLRRIPGPHKHIALVPQWDFLELLATAAAAEPTFTLLRSSEVLTALRDGHRVTGVSYRDAAGERRDLHARLTVACDGRGSTLRAAMGMVPRTFGAPMDVWWFRLPRDENDPQGLAGVFGTGHAAVAIDRGDYFQMAYIIPKGSDAALRAQGIDRLRRGVVALLPFVADRIGLLTSFDDVRLLDVQVNRLRRWYADGLLCIGDAAHAMSPVGGVGINLAIADAVAAATLLAGPLRTGRVSTRDLAKVQARRWLPTALVQSAQRVVQSRIIATAVGADGPAQAPRGVRVVNRVPALRTLLGAGVAIGPFPQRIPAFARRSPSNAPTRPHE